jgi:hypothetical protein
VAPGNYAGPQTGTLALSPNARSETLAQGGESARAVRNLLLFGVVIGLSAGWAYVNIQWLFAGVFALAGSGALAALLLIPKIIPEERGKEVQKWTWNWLFAHPRATAVYLILLGFVVLVVLFVGYIEVVATGDDTKRDVRFLPPAQGDSDDYAQALLDWDSQSLAVGGSVRDFYLLWPGTKRRVIVKVSGLPDLLAEVGHFKTQVVHAPEGLRRRPVVLLRPTSTLINYRQNKDVVVRLQNGVTQQAPFSGHAVWVGCDKDVEVPKSMLDLWDRMQPTVRATDLEYWKHPDALNGPRVELKVGESFTVSLKMSDDGRKFSEQVITVRSTTFPQVEEWHEPDE